MLTDTSSKSQTQIGVNINLANCAASCLAELILWNTNSISQVAAILINNLYILWNYRGCTVENDWEVRQLLGNLLQNIETELRWYQNALCIAGALCRSELESAVAGADSNSQGINASTLNEFLYLIRAGVSSIMCLYLYVILNAGQLAQLALYYYATLMSILYYLLGNLNVLLERTSRAIDHNGSETTVDAGLTSLEICTMIQMESYWQVRMNLQSSLYQMYQILMVCILASTSGALEDYRSMKLCSGISDTLYNLHVVYVECTDSVTALVCFFEHFFSSY